MACDREQDLPLGDPEFYREVGPDGRDYQLYIPRSYRADRPAPLVVDLHAAGEDATTQRLSGFESLAEKKGFVLARPQAEFGAFVGEVTVFARFWSLFDRTDVDYVLATIADVRTLVCIDAARVYAAGYSMGGNLTAYLACRSPQTFAAVASVAVLDHPVCDPDPTPLIAFVGRADTIYRMDAGLDPDIFSQTAGGGPPGARPGPLDDEASAWASTNGCRAEPTVQEVNTRVERRSYRCRHADFEIYVHEGGHTWPGSFDRLQASRLIWAFFEDH
ncbi:MAG TPA: PHB depolymerase family esterase [Actinomycetota bacterium]